MTVDNCPAHPKVAGLKAIRLFFLPPNTTSKTQPMDQGIIRNRKVYYRKQIILKQLKAMNRRTDLQITLLDALGCNTLLRTKRQWQLSETALSTQYLPTLTQRLQNMKIQKTTSPSCPSPSSTLRWICPSDENVNTVKSSTEEDIVESINGARNEEKEESKE